MSQWNNFKLSKLRIKNTQYKTIKWQVISNMKNENHLKTVNSFCPWKFWYFLYIRVGLTYWPRAAVPGGWAKACLICCAPGPAELCLTLQPCGLLPAKALCPRNGGTCQEWVLPTPGDPSNLGLNLSFLCLLHCRWILFCWVTEEAPWYTVNVFEKTF